MAKVARTTAIHSLSHGLLVLFGFTTLVPFLWMVLTSFKSENEVFQSHIWPQEVRLGDEGDLLKTRAGQPLRDAQGEANPHHSRQPSDPRGLPATPFATNRAA